MDIFLLGAGASAPLGIPTTQGFLKNFSVHDEEKVLFQKICNFLSSSPENADIEAIFYILENLSSCASGFLQALFQFKSVYEITSYTPQYFNAKTFVHPFISNNIEEGFATILKRLSQIAQSLKQNIKKYILEILCNFNTENVFKIFFPLFKPVVSSKKPLIIFTTNYDTVLEEAFCPKGLLAKEWKKLGAKCFYLGFECRDLVAVYNFNFKRIFEPGTISLLKLHGSITWRPYEDMVILAGKDIPFDPDIPFLIYPGYKGVPDREPFISLHQAFLYCLTRAKRLISVGFAFRDPYIYALLQHALNLNSDLKIYAFVPEFPKDSFFLSLQEIFQERIRHLPGKLGETSLWELLAQEEKENSSS